MRAFEATFESVIWRFLLMMAIIILALMSGVAILSLIAVPIFISALMAVKFDIAAKKVKREAVRKDLKVYPNIGETNKRSVA